MLLYILAILCLSYARGTNGAAQNLKWPDSYTFEATRVSLTSGVIEDYTVWKNLSSSRIDANNGVDKEIVLVTDDYEHGIKYEINPITTDDMLNEVACLESYGTLQHPIQMKEILPSTDRNNFKQMENESVNDEDTIKFFCNVIDGNSDARHTLWAKYDTEIQTWKPVKYELLKYNIWLGALDENEVWTFYNFNLNIDDSVFNTEEYNCTEKPSEIQSEIQNSITIDPENEEHVDHIFDTFKTKFNRIYAHKKEHAYRRAIFKNRLSLILSTNRQNLGYKLTINKFADRTPEELKRYQGLQRRPEGKVGNIPFPYKETKIKEIVAELPEEYDLRNLGYVAEVKNQEDCGSCWTFGTTAAVEGALARSNGGQLKTLSNQALIDCAWPFDASGCDGGTDNAAYEWMMKYGLPTEAEYGSYKNKDDLCHITNMTQLYPIRGFTDVTPFNIGALKVAVVNHGPLSVSVHVDKSFYFYSGGVFYDTECNSKDLNHEVTLVGYGERDGDTFWILKNSWGPAWGVDGYMFISSRDNNCGVATEPTYVVL